MYTIVAYPKGARTVVATLHGFSKRSDDMLAFAAMRAGVSVGSEVEGVVIHAQTQAKVRGEYVDVYRDDDQHIATVGPEGVA